MPEHNTITDPNIHEPKGVSAASVGQVYSADGAGSGSWEKIYLQGFEDYNDSGTTQNLTSGAWVDIENDGAGGNTTTAYKLPGFTDLWDTTNHEFDWSS
jgi:hypothetical protein